MIGGFSMGHYSDKFVGEKARKWIFKGALSPIPSRVGVELVTGELFSLGFRFKRSLN